MDGVDAVNARQFSGASGQDRFALMIKRSVAGERLGPWNYSPDSSVDPAFTTVRKRWQVTPERICYTSPPYRKTVGQYSIAPGLREVWHG